MKNILFLLVAFLIASCGNEKSNTTPAETKSTVTNNVALTEAQFNAAGIHTESLQQKSLSSLIKVSGKIDVPPQNLVSVSMPLGGYLKSTSLLPGMHVSKGEIIATLEDQQYIQLQQDYLTAKSELVFAEADFLRQKELNRNKASSDKVFQQAQVDYDTKKIRLSALSEKLKLININPAVLTVATLSKSVNIFSPIEGFVSKVNVNIGKYVTPADILFELVNPSDIHLHLQVFEKDLTKLAIGQKVLAYTNYEPEKKHICEIILISRDLSAARTAEVHCHFEDYDKTLLPGMYMNAEIEVKNKNAMSIPEEAVVYAEGKNYLFVMDAERSFQMMEAIIGVKDNGMIEITNAEVFTGKKIVTKGAYTLLMSLKNIAEEE